MSVSRDMTESSGMTKYLEVLWSVERMEAARKVDTERRMATNS